MSIKLMTWAFYEAPDDLTPTQVLLLLALADWADDTGLVRFTGDGRQEAIAAKTRMSRRSVQRAAEVLEERGLLERVRDNVLDPYTYRVLTSRQIGATSLRQDDASRGVTLAQRTSIDGIDGIYAQNPFDRAWKAWPRKDGKQAAVKAFKRAAVKFPGGSSRLVDAVVDRAAAYSAAGTDPQFVPHLSTWLNGERWEDPAPKVTAAVAAAVSLTERWGAGNEWMEYR